MSRQALCQKRQIGLTGGQPPPVTKTDRSPLRTGAGVIGPDWDALRAIVHAEAPAPLTAAIAVALPSVIFDGFVVAVRRAQTSAPPDERLHVLPADWASRPMAGLTDQGHPECDALLQDALRAVGPTTWDFRGRILNSHPDPNRLPTHIGQVPDSGPLSGIVVPVHGPCGRPDGWFSAGTRRCDDARRLILQAAWVQLVGTYAVEALHRLLSRADPSVRLSARERQILRWSALGKTSWETATILGLRERTVNYHLQRLARRLGVSGRRAAVARALACGLLAL